MQELKANTAVDVLIGPFVDDADGDTPITGSTLVVELSKNGQGLAIKTDATDPVHDAGGSVDGYYNCELDATDTNTEGTLTLVVHHADSLPIRHDYMVMAEAAWDSKYVAKDTGLMDVHVKTVEAGIIANASFNADVGSTAHGTNIIALACRKILEELNLDHLLKVIVSDRDTMPEVVDDTILANIMTKTDGDTSDFDHATDSLEAIKDTFVATGALSGIALNLMIDRLYTRLFHEVNVTDADGSLAIRNAADDADIATGSITDDDTTTCQTAVSWV